MTKQESSLLPRLSSLVSLHCLIFIKLVTNIRWVDERFVLFRVCIKTTRTYPHSSIHSLVYLQQINLLPSADQTKAISTFPRYEMKILFVLFGGSRRQFNSCRLHEFRTTQSRNSNRIDFVWYCFVESVYRREKKVLETF